MKNRPLIRKHVAPGTIVFENEWLLVKALSKNRYKLTVIQYWSIHEYIHPEVRKHFNLKSRNFAFYKNRQTLSDLILLAMIKWPTASDAIVKGY
jgi:hypothetical protein